MNVAREREVREVRRRLEALLAARDVTAFSSLLEREAARDLLEELRERKLILRASAEDRLHVQSLLAAVGSRVLTAIEAATHARYLDLMLLLDFHAAAVREELQHSIRRLPPMRLKDLIATSDKVFSRITNEKVDLRSAWSDPAQTIAHAERDWQDMNGFVADVTFAICRAMNEAAGSVLKSRRLRPERRSGAILEMGIAVAHASQLNALECIRDSVAFGELEVEEISMGCLPNPTEARPLACPSGRRSTRGRQSDPH